MKPDVLKAVKVGEVGRQATPTGPVVMLLFSALLVMMFSRPFSDQTLASLAALLVAAVAAGVALLRPAVVTAGDAQGRAKWLLVIALSLVGLVLTAATFLKAFEHLGAPLMVAMVAGYTILGLGGAFLAVRQSPHLPWAFTLFLVAHAGLAVAFLRSPGLPNYDVLVFLRDSSVAVLHGHDPYSMTFPNIYSPEQTQQYYGQGVVVNGRVTFGFPYMPVALLVAIPGQILGDVRYASLIAMLVTAVVLRLLASDRVGRAAAVLGVAAPAAISTLHGAATEPTSVMLLACLVLALERRRHASAALLLGIFLVSKQYFVVVIPLIWLLRKYLTRRRVIMGLGVAAAITLPFFFVNPAAFWKAVVQFQLIQPFRSDSLSLLVTSVNAFGWPPPWTYGVLPLLGGGLTSIALALRAPRTPAAFAAAVGLTLLVTILLSKQGFTNYYFLVSGAFLIAAVAWPTKQPLQNPSRSQELPPPLEDP